MTYALTDGAGNVLATVHSSSAAQQWAAETGTAVVASKV